MYDTIVKEFTLNPRDVHTVPISGKNYKWFYVFVENGQLYVEMSHDHFPKCHVKKRNLLEKECGRIFEIYQRRLKGESVSKEAQKCTRSQVYWYGIFHEIFKIC